LFELPEGQAPLDLLRAAIAAWLFGAAHLDYLAVQAAGTSFPNSSPSIAICRDGLTTTTACAHTKGCACFLQLNSGTLNWHHDNRVRSDRGQLQ
jgi:hypothetical protein